ncbi:hypothetical protein BDR26DRAFT_143378 [Obelidium mucronatum]|nr:hypothetical protein BDR26DRAFT_143378 [Obelidium mucronatum]
MTESHRTQSRPGTATGKALKSHQQYGFDATPSTAATASKYNIDAKKLFTITEQFLKDRQRASAAAAAAAAAAASQYHDDEDDSDDSRDSNSDTQDLFDRQDFNNLQNASNHQVELESNGPPPASPRRPTVERAATARSRVRFSLSNNSTTTNNNTRVQSSSTRPTTATASLQKPTRPQSSNTSSRRELLKLFGNDNGVDERKGGGGSRRGENTTTRSSTAAAAAPTTHEDLHRKFMQSIRSCGVSWNRKDPLAIPTTTTTTTASSWNTNDSSSYQVTHRDPTPHRIRSAPPVVRGFIKPLPPPPPPPPQRPGSSVSSMQGLNGNHHNHQHQSGLEQRPRSAPPPPPPPPHSNAPAKARVKSAKERNEIVQGYLETKIHEPDCRLDKSALQLKKILLSRQQEKLQPPQDSSEIISSAGEDGFAAQFIKQYIKEVSERDKLLPSAAEGELYYKKASNHTDATSDSGGGDRTSLAYRRGRTGGGVCGGKPTHQYQEFIKSLKKKSFERTATDVDRIYNTTRSLPAFSNLTPFYLYQISKVVTLVEYPAAGAYVFEQGQEGTAWYVVLSGAVSVEITKTGLGVEENVMVRVMGVGEGFGDIALKNKCQRTATVQTLFPTELLKVEKEDYDRHLRTVHIHETGALHSFFCKVPAFEGWTKSSLLAVTQRTFRNTYKLRHVIYVEGEDLKTIYFLKSGIVSVIKTITHENKPPIHAIVGLIQPRQYFGEEGFQKNPKFDSIAANTTMLAGDATKMTPEEIHISIVSKLNMSERLVITEE